MELMTNRRNQAVTGLTPPQLDEAKIRVTWPSVAAYPKVAAIGRFLMLKTVVFAPLAWLMLAPFYFLKVLPGLGRRYVLTNRRLMIQKGTLSTVAHEVALADIDEVRIKEDENSAFFRSGTLEIVSRGNVAMLLPGVPQPESFRHAIINAYQAWVPGKAVTGNFIPASATK
jgi:hypothetical protein